jgi:hypothetical protein
MSASRLMFEWVEEHLVGFRTLERGLQVLRGRHVHSTCVIGRVNKAMKARVVYIQFFLTNTLFSIAPPYAAHLEYRDRSFGKAFVLYRKSLAQVDNVNGVGLGGDPCRIGQLIHVFSRQAKPIRASRTSLVLPRATGETRSSLHLQPHHGASLQSPRRFPRQEA